VKKLAHSLLLPTLGFAVVSGFSLLSDDASANPLTASGAHCKPLASGTYSYTDPAASGNTIGITKTGSSSGTVSCLIPMDATALGSTVTFKLRVLDNSTTQGFTCTPYVVNQNGVIIASGATRTTTAAATGTLTIGAAVAWTASVPGNVNTNLYAIQCAIPGNNSRIYTARAE
jgi:hypothetical protein